MTHSLPKYGRPKHFPKGFCFSHTSRQIFLDGSSGRFVLLPNRTCGRENVALSDPTAGMDSNLFIAFCQHDPTYLLSLNVPRRTNLVISPQVCHLPNFTFKQKLFNTKEARCSVFFSSFSHSPVISVIPGPAPPAPRIPI